MNIEMTLFDKVFVIKSKVFIDNRGIFIKTYHKKIFEEYGLNSEFRESFFFYI